MKSLGEILKKQMKFSPVGQQVNATVIVGTANSILTQIFGAPAKRFAQAIYFKDKTLAITCLSSVMAQEIKLSERKILKELNDKLGVFTVEKIRYLA